MKCKGMTMNTGKKAGKVLSFEQKGDFFFKRGLDRLDKNDLPSALSNYRMALERDPENAEIRMSIAEVLTDMERYEESNRILIDLIRDDNCDPECYFGMGCNFMGLNDFEHARDSLDRFTELDPEGELIYDALDMLDALDDAEYEEKLRRGEEGLVELTAEEEACTAAEEGRRLLEQDEYDAAIAELERSLKLMPKLHWARNNLTLALFCKRQYKRAIREAVKVFEYDRDNLQALCNLAMLHNSLRNKTDANRAADRIVELGAEAQDDLNRASLVLIDLGRFEEAYAFAKKLVREFPYDAEINHRFGMCCYETGRYREAVGRYDLLLKVDSDDTIARYYRGICRAAEIGGKPDGRKFMINYQVPFDEMILRISRLNQLVGKPHDRLEELWKTDNELAGIIRWGFTLPDPGIKRALLMLASSFKDEKGEGLLRDFVMLMDQPDELKEDAFGLLAQQNAEEPYVGYIGGRLVESRISVGSFPKGVTKPYRDALSECMSAMHGNRSDAIMGTAIVLWEKLVRSYDGSPPAITRAQGTALAAALEYRACSEAGEKISRTEVCAKYGVSAQRLKNALTRLERLERQEE